VQPPEEFQFKSFEEVQRIVMQDQNDFDRNNPNNGNGAGGQGFMQNYVIYKCNDAVCRRLNITKKLAKEI